MYKVIDNFLPDEIFAPIYDCLMGDQYPWYYNNSVANKTDINFYFTHILYEWEQGAPCSDFFEIIGTPILDRLPVPGIFWLNRFRTNMYTNQGKKIIHKFHIDDPKEKSIKVGLFSINTNNGYKTQDSFKKFVPSDILVAEKGDTSFELWG